MWFDHLYASRVCTCDTTGHDAPVSFRLYIHCECGGMSKAIIYGFTWSASCCRKLQRLRSRFWWMSVLLLYGWKGGAEKTTAKGARDAIWDCPAAKRGVIFYLYSPVVWCCENAPASIVCLDANLRLAWMRDASPLIKAGNSNVNPRPVCGAWLRD